MNKPPESFKRISADQLCEFTGACLKAAGMPPDHADQLAGLLTSGDLRGVRSHGTRQAVGYCRSLREGGINPNPDLKVLKETDTSILIDGDGGLGYAPMMMATEKAIPKAKDKGVAVGATRHIGHYGSAGYYVRRAMEEDCTAFSVQGGGWDFSGGRRNKTHQAAYWGNPPFSFGLSGQEGPPFVLDMATCILADYQRGEEFDALQELIPAAFFKSMGMTGIATALGNALVGTHNQKAEEIKARWPGANVGGLIVVMDIGIFAPAEEVRNGIDKMVRGVRETMIPVRGYEEATLPGTLEFRNEEAYKRDGIPYDLEELKRLEDLGRELGITPGWTGGGIAR